MLRLLLTARAARAAPAARSRRVAKPLRQVFLSARWVLRSCAPARGVSRREGDGVEPRCRAVAE
jgi:hypothetical protein